MRVHSSAKLVGLQRFAISPSGCRAVVVRLESQLVARFGGRWLECHRQSRWMVVLACVFAASIVGEGVADEFRLAPGPTVERLGENQFEAQWLGEKLGYLYLKRADGHIDIVPQADIVSRIPGDGPGALSPAETVARLTERFTAEKFRAAVHSPYVVGIVLEQPLREQFEPKLQAVLLKAGRFFKTAETVILDYFREVGIEVHEPQHALTVLLFETDELFNAYAKEATRGQGLIPDSILGFYSVISNELVLRLSECDTFETPLHEAVHQVCYNSGVFQRMSRVPLWMVEGVAMGFQGTGEKVNVNPFKLNTRYARLALGAKQVNWKNLVDDDAAFTGNALAGEAYPQGWGLHWLLATRHRDGYAQFLREASRFEPGVDHPPTERQQLFNRCFDVSLEKLEREFLPALESAAKKQKLSGEDAKKPGRIQHADQLGYLDLTAVAAGIQANAETDLQGKLKNQSTFRPLSYYVTARVSGGLYAEWYVPNVDPQRVVKLPQKRAQNRMQRPVDIPAGAVQVTIQSALPDGAIGQAWESGDLPRP